jgi:hypothetical protein
MRLSLPFRSPSADQCADWIDGDDAEMVHFLDAHAADLKPDDATIARIGTSVRAAFVESQVARRDATAAPTAGARKLSWGRHRVLAAVGAVAILTVSSVGLAAAQSGPGQPFYRLRLVIETVNRPPAGSLTRLDTDLDRADARLNEMAGEAASSDWNGAADAAAAYREVISAVALPADASSTGSVRQRLNKQLAYLEELRASSRGPEKAELDRAVAALCLILGIPVPTPTPALVPSPAPTPSNHDRSGETIEPRATAGDAGSGSQPGHSPSPSTLPNDEGSSNSGANTGRGMPGDSGVDHQGPGSMPTYNEAKTAVP